MRPTVPALVGTLALLACGGPSEPAPPPAPPATSGAEEPDPLDWALLLPIETDAIFRIDLARLRRSPHRQALEPLLRSAIENLGEGARASALMDLMERTEVLLVATLPDEEEEGEATLVVLARGAYQPDEIARLEQIDQEGAHGETIDVRGTRVWVEPDGSALAQLRQDTLVLAPAGEQMRRLIARAGMVAGGRRWPPAVRDLVEQTDLEGATVAFALRALPDDGTSLAFAGRMDADGPLDAEIRLRLDEMEWDSSTSAMFEEIMHGMVEALARERPGLGDLPRLIRVEANGSFVTLRLHAELDEAAAILPPLVGLFTDERGVASPFDMLAP